MQKNYKNNNKNAFDGVIKEKLEHYLLPLDNEVWPEIEKRLNKKTGKRLFMSWISSAAAVAFIALGWLIFSYNNKIIDYGTTEQLPDHETKVTDKIPDEKNMPTVLSSIHRVKRIADVRKAGRKTIETDTVSEFDVIEIEPETVADLTVTESNKLPPEPPDAFAYVALSKKKTSMSFYIGSGGALMAMNDRPSNNSDFFSYADASEIISNAPAQLRSAVFTEDKFSDITHFPPLSFGATFKKELNHWFALESGLVYTFLSSRFENKKPVRSATLHLHYLGVPLNLHTKIIDNRQNKWSIYLSTGFMLEKGLLAYYSQNENFDNLDGSNFAIEKVSFTQKINGWQWSLNAALGIEYKVIKNYSIYLEPKVSYYLKNNQPESARTENPLIIGLNAGIRYSW
jgi:hypothetical protein